MQNILRGLFRSATTAERNAKALYIALQKQRLLGDADLWFLEDQDARYVSEIARVVREKIDELRHKSGSGNDERSLLPGTELEGTLQFKGTPVMQWKARFGKRGLVAYVYADVRASDGETRAQNPDDATASHFGVEKAAGKWVAVKQLEKNLLAGENNRTLDTVLLQAAKLQFTDALRRMRQAFRRGTITLELTSPSYLPHLHPRLHPRCRRDCDPVVGNPLAGHAAREPRRRHATHASVFRRALKP